MYVVVFGLSYGPLIWTLPSEVFDNMHRAKGVGLAVAVSWLANFVIVGELLFIPSWLSFSLFYPRERT